MRSDTASMASPTSLLLAGRERSTITSTKSTRIRITPNMLVGRDGQHHQTTTMTGNHLSRQPPRKTHTHRNPKDMTKGVIFFRILLQKEERAYSDPWNLICRIICSLEVYKLTGTSCLAPRSHPFHRQSPP